MGQSDSDCGREIRTHVVNMTRRPRKLRVELYWPLFNAPFTRCALQRPFALSFPRHLLSPSVGLESARLSSNSTGGTWRKRLALDCPSQVMRCVCQCKISVSEESTKRESTPKHGGAILKQRRFSTFDRSGSGGTITITTLE